MADATGYRRSGGVMLRAHSGLRSLSMAHLWSLDVTLMLHDTDEAKRRRLDGSAFVQAVATSIRLS